MKREKINLICISGILTAIVFVLTAYLHIPSHTGYTHIGDGIIYLAACFLPLPYAIFVGATGALLADTLSGFTIWAPASVLIKAATVLPFTRRARKIITVRNLLALIPAWCFCIGGYYFYECLIVGNFLSPIAGIPGYIMQSLLSSVLFITLGLALDKFKFKELFIGGLDK